MILSLIVAAANNMVIGHENRLIWHLPADLKYFKSKTMGHTLIMGRKTYESIGFPLKGRTSIILTRQPDYTAPEGCLLANSLEEAIKLVAGQKEVFIAGGEEVYRKAIDMHQARRIYMTRVFADFDGDAYFPEIDPDKWQLVSREDQEPDEKNALAYSFQTYRRKPSCRKNIS